MAIQLDPKRLRVPPQNTAKAEQRRREGTPSEPLVIPSRAHINHIPAPESLRTLIAGAIVALKRGVHWERGTILNLLV